MPLHTPSNTPPTGQQPAKIRHAEASQTSSQLLIDLPERLDPAALSQQVLRMLSSQAGVTSCMLVMLSEPNGEVFVASRLYDGSISLIDNASAHKVLATPLISQVLQEGQGLLISDLARDRRRHLVPEYRTGSYIIWPIMRGGKPLGVLTAHSPLAYSLSGQELPQLRALITMAGTALGEAMRAREESTHRDQTLALLTMSQMLTNELSATELANILHHSGQVFHAHHQLLFLAESSTNLLPVSIPPALTHPANGAMLQRIVTLATQSWSTRTALTIKPKVGEAPIHSVAFPLVHNGFCWGSLVLVFNDAHAMRFSPSTWSLLTILTQMVASACAQVTRWETGAGNEQAVEALLSQRSGQIQRSRDLIRAAFDSMREGILLIDANDRVVAANNAFCQNLLNRHPRHVVGLQHDEVWRQVRRQSQVIVASSALHVRHVLPNGQVVWYSVQLSEVPDRSEQGAQFVEIWRELDIQEVMLQ